MSNQTIKHRRGPIGSVASIADYRKAELIIATGSVDSKFSNPVVMIADPDGTGASSGYRPVSRLYTGAGLPNVTPAGFGESLNGLPYYDSTNKKLYILGSNANGIDGHTEIQLTGSSINNFAMVRVLSRLYHGSVPVSSFYTGGTHTKIGGDF